MKTFRIFFILVILFVSAEFLLTSFQILLTNNYSGMGGQGSWITMGHDIKNGSYFSDGNTNPLYPLVLAGFAKPNIRGFTQAKIFSFILMTFTLFIFWFLAKHIISKGSAIVAFVLLAFNWTILSMASTLRPEVLLVPLFLGAWYFTIKGFNNWRWWIPAGAFAGLAYLTKGTGQLLPIVFFITVIIYYGKKIGHQPKVLSWFISYSLVAGVLWTYNYKTFGDPFYSYPTKHYIWFEDYQDVQSTPHDNLPTLSSYIKTHSIKNIVSREIKGIMVFAPVFIKVLFPSRSYLAGFIFRYPFFILIMLQIIIALIYFRSSLVNYFKRNQPMMIFSSCLIVIFFLLFSWYHQNTPSERFITSVIPICFILIGEFFYKTGMKILNLIPLKKQSIGNISKTIFLVILVCSLIIKLFTYEIKNPFIADKIPEHIQHTITWMEGLTPDTRILYGESDILPIWLVNPMPKILPVPKIDRWHRMTEFIGTKKITYAVIDYDMIKRHSVLFEPFFSFIHGTEKLSIKKLPDKWEPVYIKNGIPTIVIFKIGPFAK